MSTAAIIAGVVWLLALIAALYAIVVFYRHKRQWRDRANGLCPCGFCRFARDGW